MHTKNEKYFIALDDVKISLQEELSEVFDDSLFKDILNKFLIVTVLDDNNKYLWYEEVELCKYLLILNKREKNKLSEEIYCKESFWTKTIDITPNTTIIYEMGDSNKAIPAFVRNILYLFRNEDSEECETAQFELLGITVRTTSKKICSYIQNAIFRKMQLDRIKKSSFAHTSSYMGSKKKLTGFIVEAMFPHCKDESVFLDIMCGSGAVSNALAQVGSVYASDAQEFCGLLAKIQGTGFNKNRAQKLIKEIHRHYTYHLEMVSKHFSKELEIEDAIFRMDLDEKEKVFAAYYEFVTSYDLYSNTYYCSDIIQNEIAKRKQNNKETPYCLFAYYYANVFFGVAQSIQLDSIRYAIDQIKDEKDKQWAMGVLVVVTSLISTTYGGHFAQPRRLDIDNFEKIMYQRSKSAWLEFSKRMLSISFESERYANEIKIIEGPWKKALDYFDTSETNSLVVYLDAPYKREEYSRYYHVLETMVKYDYPSSENKGRMRSKELGERFSTEFFSKSQSKITLAFEKIILEILSKNAICVWSYSNNGAIKMKNIIEKIKESTNCNVYFYSTPYKHSTQGKVVKKGFGKIDVIEYCVIFVKKEQ